MGCQSLEMDFREPPGKAKVIKREPFTIQMLDASFDERYVEIDWEPITTLSLFRIAPQSGVWGREHRAPA